MFVINLSEMVVAKKTQKKEKLNKKASKATPVPKKNSTKPVKKTSKTPTVSVKSDVKSTKKPAKKVSNKKSVEIIESTSETSKINTSKKSKSNQKFYDQLKLSESYVSLVLGAVVVVGISFLFLVFLKESRKTNLTKPEVLNAEISPVLTKTPAKTYTMGENETLWDVAVKFYGDGFAYPKIIEANKDVIQNADFVPPGTVIIIPDAK